LITKTSPVRDCRLTPRKIQKSLFAKGRTP